MVVLDEADQMLDIGFRPAVETISSRRCRETRQTLLLSATMPPEVRELAHTYLVDPVDVRLIKEDEDATIPAIRQMYLMVAAERKFELLIKLLRREEPPTGDRLLPDQTRSRPGGHVAPLEGLLADTMHGNLSQRSEPGAPGLPLGPADDPGRDRRGRPWDRRPWSLARSSTSTCPRIRRTTCTRIGRTGRMGSDGVAFSLVLPDQGKLLDRDRALHLARSRAPTRSKAFRSAPAFFRPPVPPRRLPTRSRSPARQRPRLWP